MKKKLSKKLISWLGVIGFITILTQTINVAMGIYIWDEVKDLNRLIMYHVAMFAAIPVASIFSGYITDRKNPKTSLTLSFLLYTVLLIVAGFYKELLLSNLMGFGVITGVAIALQAIPTTSINGINISKEESDRFFSVWNVMALIVAMMLPPVIAFSKNTFGGLAPVFMLALPAAPLALALLSKSSLKLPNRDVFDVKLAFGSIKRNPDSGYMIWSLALSAFKDGVFWMLQNIIAIVLLGSIAYWGIFAVSMKLLRILVSWMLTKVEKVEVSRSMYMVGGFIYTAMTIVLVVNFSVASFLAFSVVDAVFSVFNSIVFSDIGMRMMNQDPLYHKENLETEYAVLRELYLGLGRVVPLFILGLVFAGLSEEGMVEAMKMTFILVGFVPQLLMLVLAKSKSMHEIFSSEVLD